jgi:O-methyltransferase
MSVPQDQAESEVQNRYLELLKNRLTRTDGDIGFMPVVPESPWKRRLWHEVSRLLDRRGIVALRRSPDQRELREDGRDWPVTAETMIGLRRMENLRFCVESVLEDGVPGDLIETGVWRGGSAIFMRGILAAHGDAERTVWVADSFEGLPKPRAEHAADSEDLHWTQPALAISLEEVRGNFEKYGLLDDRVRFIKGWFSDTLASAPVDRLSVLRVDCDMYGSVTDVLDAMYPKLEVGGFAIIDDYGALESCASAVNDYRSRHGIQESMIEIDWTGIYWRKERQTA